VVDVVVACGLDVDPDDDVDPDVEDEFLGSHPP